MSKYPEYTHENHRNGLTEHLQQFPQVFTATSVRQRACSFLSQNGR